MDYIKAFIIGGIICVIGQILIDKTKLTPARILVGYVVAGVLLSATGIYEPVAEFAGAENVGLSEIYKNKCRNHGKENNDRRHQIYACKIDKVP